MPMELQLRYAELSIPCAIANLEALKAELQPKLDYYKNLVVTEDGIKAAKDDKAKLNKLKKAIDEQRIAVKKKCLEPYETLEKECKEVESPILDAVKVIDDQIKAFDEKARNEKLFKLKTAFYKMTHHEWLSFESVLPPKWENKTEKTDKLIEEMRKAVDTVNVEYAEITKMYLESPLLTAIADRYKSTRNKADTLAYAVTLEKQYQAEQERKKELEAKQRESLESNLNSPEIDCGKSDTTILGTAQTAAESVSECSQTISGTFKVTCTRQQLVSLRDFMKNNGIKFEVVK